MKTRDLHPSVFLPTSSVFSLSVFPHSVSVCMWCFFIQISSLNTYIFLLPFRSTLYILRTHLFATCSFTSSLSVSVCVSTTHTHKLVQHKPTTRFPLGRTLHITNTLEKAMIYTRHWHTSGRYRRDKKN